MAFKMKKMTMMKMSLSFLTSIFVVLDIDLWTGVLKPVFNQFYLFNIYFVIFVTFSALLTRSIFQKKKSAKDRHIHAIPSIFIILSVGFLLIEENKGLVFNVYYLWRAEATLPEGSSTCVVTHTHTFGRP